MCAIFGFVSRKNQPVDLSLVRSIVAANIGRGPHAFGFAWIDRRGVMHSFKQTGRLSDKLAILRMAADARLLVGHLRWATHGSPEDQINNHPHPCDGGWLVHNGVVRNYDSLVNRFRLNPVSECDSEAIALLTENSDGSRSARLTEAVDLTVGPLAVLSLWSRPAELVAIRRGNPLHVAQLSGGVYLATMASGLPGRWQLLPDGAIAQIRVNQTMRVRRAVDADEPASLYDAACYRGG